MARLLDDVASFDVPSGGLAFWLSLKEPVDPYLLKRALKDHDVHCLLGSDCMPGARQVTGVRIGYASLTEHEMEKSLRALHQALRHPSKPTRRLHHQSPGSNI